MINLCPTLRPGWTKGQVLDWPRTWLGAIVMPRIGARWKVNPDADGPILMAAPTLFGPAAVDDAYDRALGAYWRAAVGAVQPDGTIGPPNERDAQVGLARVFGVVMKRQFRMSAAKGRAFFWAGVGSAYEAGEPALEALLSAAISAVCIAPISACRALEGHYSKLN